MQTPFFSIIIPVYNGLTHDLSLCLDSIWQQPLDKSLYEVICVDDCSTDGTRKWLEEQCLLHNNLTLIKNKVNIRQGGGRNKGVKEANGKWILFLDQDDYYHKGGLMAVYDEIKNSDLEIFVSDSAYQFKGYESNKLQLNLPNRDVLSSEDFVKQNGFAIAPWRLAIRKDFYDATKVEFPEKCRIEDVDWAVNLFFYARRIQYKPILLVHYNKAESGTTDNMYRNKEILIANTLAGNRVMKHANGLYLNSSIRPQVIALADTYYNFSCKYILGLFCSIKEKTDIIRLIPNDITSNYPLVRIACKHPVLYSIMSNLTVPLFRIVRKIHRNKMKKAYQ